MTRPRPIAIVDVDGVVAGFTPALLSAIGGRLTEADIVTWDIFSFMTEQERAHAHAVLRDPAFFMSLPVIPGAQAGVAKLRETYEVVWATSPWSSCFGWEDARRTWLKTHFGARARDVLIAPRKDVLAGALLIDDKPEHIENAYHKHAAVLFDAPYNRDTVWHHRLLGWADLERTLALVKGAI